MFFKDKTDQILIQLQEMNAKGGMKKIQAQFKEMQQKTNIKLWAEHFNSINLTFAENKVDFETKNLKALFEYQYLNKECLNINKALSFVLHYLI